MSKTKKNIDEYFHNGSEIDEAMQEAVKKALLQHKKAGNPVASWGKTARSSGFSLRTFLLRKKIGDNFSR